MRVLIVDDEEHVREGIDLAVDWEQFDIDERFQAENGSEALEMIRRHKPGIVFCDMSMPEMNGIQLLDLIRRDYPDIQIIVVSGYDDFIYTQATIRAKGVDYILKPFKKRDLEQALSQAVALCKQRESSMRAKRDTGFLVQQADYVVMEQKMSQMLKGDDTSMPELENYCRKLGMSPSCVRISLILMRNGSSLMKRRYDGDSGLFSFAVKNIAEESLEGFGSHLLFHFEEELWVLVTGETPGSEMTSSLNFYIRKMTEAWNSTIGLKTFTGVSRQVSGLLQIQQQYWSARAELTQSPILAGQRAGLDRPVLSDRELQLNIALENGDKQRIEEVIHGFTDELQQCGNVTLADLQRYTKEANYMTERACLQMDKDMEGLSLSIWISYIEEWGSKWIQQWWRLIEECGNHGYEGRSIQLIHDYIEQHFHENFSLNELSERFHFSPQHIARRFKEKYNMTVITYQTGLRMQKAKSLLEHTDLPVVKISEMIGYQDESYFSKVFRRQHGLSPLKYRKMVRGS
ncbi:response regulator [Paenibacillus sp. FSL W8-0186]|uniref:response regulator n=1 Tax=Paenibacillus sp. FSL W8-0186 TaxID=2921709 RepID=UPI0030CC8B1F